MPRETGSCSAAACSRRRRQSDPEHAQAAPEHPLASSCAPSLPSPPTPSPGGAETSRACDPRPPACCCRPLSCTAPGPQAGATARGRRALRAATGSEQGSWKARCVSTVRRRLKNSGRIPPSSSSTWALARSRAAGVARGRGRSRERRSHRGAQRETAWLTDGAGALHRAPSLLAALH